MTDLKIPNIDTPLDMFDGGRPSPSLSPADAALTIPPSSTPLPIATTLLTECLSGPATPAYPLFEAPTSASPPVAPPLGAPTAPPPGPEQLSKGCVQLDATKLRQLRHAHLLSQQEMADDCWRRNYRIGPATIKRAELGSRVRYRIARELARYFNVPVTDLLLA